MSFLLPRVTIKMPILAEAHLSICTDDRRRKQSRNGLLFRIVTILSWSMPLWLEWFRKVPRLIKAKVLAQRQPHRQDKGDPVPSGSTA